MSPRARRLIPQLAVLVPTVAASIILAHRGVPPLRRLITSLGLALILLSILTMWRLTQGARSQR